jgi:hypothetical protein
MRTAWDVLQDNTAQYSQSPSGPPTLGSAVGGLLSDWTDFASNNIEESFPWIAENDPKAIGKSMLESLFGAGRISKAERAAMGQKHKIGGDINLNKIIPGTNQTDHYVPEMSRTVESTGLLHPYKTISPEVLQGGEIIPFWGDRSGAGELLTHIGGNKLPTPIDLVGGNQFMQNNPEAAWASGAGVISKLQKAAQETLGRGNTPYGAFMPMGWDSMDYSHMMVDGLLGQMKDNLSGAVNKKLGIAVRKKQKAALEQHNRKQAHLGRDAVKFNKDDANHFWPGGLLGDDVSERLMAAPGARKALMEALSLKEVQAMRGVPDLPETRFAVADQSLLHTPFGHGGQNISSLTGDMVSNPSTPHRSYDTQLERDKYFGGFDAAIPPRVMFPDFHAWRAGKHHPGKSQAKMDSEDIRSMQFNTIVPQPANQEWLDGVMGYIERAKQGLL